MILEACNPALLCLQETKISEERQCSVRGYTAYHCIGPMNSEVPSGGVSILANNKIPQEALALNTNLQAVAIRVSLNRVISVCNIYIPPTAHVQQQELEDLISQLQPPFIILGDFNAHHTMWGCTNVDHRGQIMESIIEALDLCLMNTGMTTYIHPATGTSSALDLSLCHPSLASDYSWHLLDDSHGSDHFPILIQPLAVTLRGRVPTFNIKRANWVQYEAMCKTDITNIITLATNPVESFTYKLQSICEQTIPKTSSKPRKYHCPWFDQECHAALAERKRVLNIFKRRPTSANLAAYRQARANCRYIIKNKKKQSWKTYVNKLNPTTPANIVWNMIRKIQGRSIPPCASFLVKDNISYSTSEDIANILAETLCHISSSQAYSAAFQQHRNAQERIPLDFTSNNLEGYNQLFSFDELQQALSKSHDTAVGQDLIHYQMLKHLPTSALMVLLKIYNIVWVSGIFPDGWRKAIVISIPKPGKDAHDPNNYRPISLTSCLCKTMERMVNDRLVWYLESEGILNTQQSGFRKGRSTTDHLIRLEAAVREAFLLKQHTVAVFFDLEKAYDTTWKYGILKDLHRYHLRGRLPIFISQFLANRTFQVRVDNTLSRSFPQENGVTQGSVLSVTLFSIKINSITACLPADVSCCLYVDDFTIFYSSVNMAAIERKLQLSINRLQSWTEKNGFRFSVAKTVCMHFCNLRGLHPDPVLKLYDQDLPVVPEAKFLGITFDHKLNFKSHIQGLKDRCNRAMNILKVVSGRDWGADSVVLLRLYRSLIRSKLDYGCVVYGAARPSYLKSLNAVHHQGLRIALGAFRTSPIPSLYVASGEPPLGLRREKLTLQLALRLKATPSNPAHTTVFAPRFVDRFSNRPNMIPTLGIRLARLVNEATMDLNTIAPTSVLPTPPWLMPRPQVHFHLAGLKKQNTDPMVYKTLLYEFIGLYSHYQQAYTDGSKGNDGVSCAAVFPTVVLRHRLPDSCSIFTAELHAIQLALEHVSAERRDTVIFSDSKSCLEAIHNKHLDHPKVREVLLTLKALYHHINIVFCWIPSHIGITGNEQADIAAKSALTCGHLTRLSLPFSDLRPQIENHIWFGWQQRWSEEVNNKLHKIRPTVNFDKMPANLCRRSSIVLTRSMIGHTHATHGFLLRREPLPLCTGCGEPLSVEHILINCTDLSFIRHRFYTATSIEELFDTCPADTILSFLKETGFYYTF